MKYEVILFDADETLFDFKKSKRETFKNTMIEFPSFSFEVLKYHIKVTLSLLRNLDMIF